MKNKGLLTNVLLSGLLIGALLGMFHFSHAAVTPNSAVFAQSISTFGIEIATADQTTPASFFAAGAQGTRIYKILCGPDDDGTGANREISIYLYDGANSHRMVLVDVTEDDAADVVMVDLLANLPQSVDGNGNKYIDIQAGYSIYYSAENVAATNPLIVHKVDF